MKKKKTGENIKHMLFKKFQDIGFDGSLFKELRFVTDQGASIVFALNQYERYDCCAHVINTILRNTFKDDFVSESLPEIKNLFSPCKTLVTYMKQSGLMNMLPKTLHQEIETRWNSRLLMLTSIQEQFENTLEILFNRNEDYRVADINREILKCVMYFLQPFKEISDLLEKEKHPTFQNVVLGYYTLQDHFSTPISEEDNILLTLKKRAVSFLKNKLIIKLDHKIATFLNPKFKHLRMLNAQER